MTKILIEEATVKQVLEALEFAKEGKTGWTFLLPEAISALRKLMAEQPAQQEPVAWVCEGSSSDEKHAIDYWPGDVDDLPIGTQLYTSPPAQRTWVGLTDEEITDIWAESSPYYHEDDFARAIEAKLKEKNT